MLTIPTFYYKQNHQNCLNVFKRQRKPSQIADSINQYKQENQQNRKNKKPSYSQETIIQQSLACLNQKNNLNCIFSNGRQINITIVKKGKNFKRIKKPNLLIRQDQNHKNRLNNKLNNKVQKQTQLFSLFLLAASQINRDQQNEKNKNNKKIETIKNDNQTNKYFYQKLEKHQIDKFSKISQKFKKYENKINNLFDNYLYL